MREAFSEAWEFSSAFLSWLVGLALPFVIFGIIIFVVIVFIDNLGGRDD